MDYVKALHIRIRCSRCGRSLGRWRLIGRDVWLPDEVLMRRGHRLPEDIGPRSWGRFQPLEPLLFVSRPFKAGFTDRSLILECSCRSGLRRRRVSISKRALLRLAQRETVIDL